MVHPMLRNLAVAQVCSAPRDAAALERAVVAALRVRAGPSGEAGEE
jgi:hypothetical protein